VRAWIDLSNSPHPLLFAPITRRLEETGDEVLLTARDNAQTLELARAQWPHVAPVGGASPTGRIAKGRAIASRARELLQWARVERPDVALSHGSYAQVTAARAAGIPALTAMDYEHQPANHVAFRAARRVLLPRALADVAVVRTQGAKPAKTRHYDGLKEEIYLGDFEPDREVLDRLPGLGPGGPLVVVRTPPSGALYHRAENRRFLDILRTVVDAGARCVVLTRKSQQREEVLRLDLPRTIVPDAVLDGRSLIYAADLMVGAGGTMTREAALMGIPTVSVFAGKPAAVDTWLERRGMMRRARSADELPSVRPRDRPPREPVELRARGEPLIAEFIRNVRELAAPATERAGAAYAQG
jgi:hypothetical protein